VPPPRSRATIGGPVDPPSRRAPFFRCTASKLLGGFDEGGRGLGGGISTGDGVGGRYGLVFFLLEWRPYRSGSPSSSPSKGVRNDPEYGGYALEKSLLLSALDFLVSSSVGVHVVGGPFSTGRLPKQ